jgi:hypothetical protein
MIVPRNWSRTLSVVFRNPPIRAAEPIIVTAPQRIGRAYSR